MGEWIKCLASRLVRGETFLLLTLLALPAIVSAQGTSNRAGLIVRFGDGNISTRCVTFNEPSITGMELLTRAGFAIRVDTSSSIGAGVCKINSQGCDAGQSCFCQCEGATCAYWQYFYAQTGAWKYSNLGAALVQVSDGAVEGWSWGNNVAPPMLTLDQICAAGQSPATGESPTPMPASPAPAPTRVPVSTFTATIPSASPTAVSTVAAFNVATASSEPTLAPTAVVSPTSVPTAHPTGAPTIASSASSGGAPSSAISYMIFGVIVLGLGAWLVVQSRRKVR